MAKHCAKHDITGDECWCCEEEKLIADGTRDAAYSDPQFLAKRGGEGAHKQIQMSSTLSKLSQLSPEHLDNLIALAQGGAGRRQVVVAPSH